MYINQRNKIRDIFDTAVEAVYCAVQSQDSTYLAVAAEGLSAVSEYMKNIPGCAGETGEIDEILVKEVYEMQKLETKKGREEAAERICAGIRRKKDCILRKRCRYKAVFMPYKASMWTSLESIWLAAEKDPDCDAVVMPLPYYDIGDARKVKEIYEGDRFPKNVPITEYSAFDLAGQEPEMGFIHNPYDDKNNLTWVHPRYFSGELKKHIRCLVYSPYFTIAAHTLGDSDYKYVEPGIFNADKIAVQSEQVSRIFQSYGHRKDKMIVHGSPKMDAVVTMRGEDYIIPEEWKEKLHGGVFLLNTHLAYLPNAFAYAGSMKNYATRYLTELLDFFADNDECSLIWRPHPLSKAVLEGKAPECLEFVREAEDRIRHSRNCVMDQSDDYRMAFWRSDALISTYSSLINEYMATGKPVMIFQTRQGPDAAARAPVKRNLNYFRFGAGGMGFPDFVHMVMEGKDPGREERMEMMRQSFLNLDGSAGEKIYREVVKFIIGENGS